MNVRGRPASLAAALLGLALAAGAGATVLDPQPPGAHTLRSATQLLESGRLEEGRALLREIIEREPGNEPAFLLLGRSHLEHEPVEARAVAIAVLRSGRRSDAALGLLSASFERMRAQGMTPEQEREVRALEIDDYRRVLEEHPEWTDARYRRAAQRVALERLLPQADRRARREALEQAERDLRTVLEALDADTAPRERAAALDQLGQLLVQRAALEAEAGSGAKRVARLNDEAAASLRQAVALDPWRVDAVAEQVQLALARGRGEEAEAALREALAASPDPAVSARLEAMLGNLLVERGQARQAIEALERAVSLAPRTPEAYVGLYRAHLALGEEAGARDAMQRAVAAMPDFITGHLELGRMEAARGDYESAIRRFEILLSIPPQRARVIGARPSRNAHRNRRYHDAAAWLAWLYLEKRGHAEQALRMVERAARFGPLTPALADTRGWALYRLGRLEEARAVLARTAREAGDFPAVHYHLARVLEALGEKRAALAAVQRALAFERDFEGRDEAIALRRALSG